MQTAETEGTKPQLRKDSIALRYKKQAAAKIAWFYGRETMRGLDELVRFDSEEARDAWVAAGNPYLGEGHREALTAKQAGTPVGMQGAIERACRGMGPCWSAYDAPEGGERFGL